MSEDSNSLPGRQPAGRWRVRSAGSRATGRPGDVVARVARISGPLTTARVDQALADLVARHEALRMGVVDRDGVRWQQLRSAPAVRARTLAAGSLAEATGRVAEQIAARWDLESSPVRCWIVRISEHDAVLALAASRTVCDDRSMSVLWQEFAAGYAGRPSAEPAARYTELLEARECWLRGPAADEQRGYWREELADDVPAPRLTVEPVRTDEAPHVVAVAPDADLRAAVDALARSRATGDDVVLLAGLLALLHRQTLQEQLVVGVEVDCRPPGGERLVGNLTNELPLRVLVEPDLPFTDLVDRTALALARVRAHRELPADEVLAALPRPAGALLHTVFVPPDPVAGEVPHIDGVRIDELPIDPPTANRWSTLLRTLLAAAAARPSTRLDELALRPAAEQATVVRAINSGVAVYPDLRPVHAAFTRIAAGRPELVAVEGAGTAVTYGELDARAGALAGTLAEAGIGPERRVGVLVERSVELIVALLATWKAGAAVVPLDPRMPVRRVALIAEDAELATILTQEQFRDHLAAQPAALTIVPPAGAPTPPTPATSPPVTVTPDNTAYVYYTSGSTGVPKGVVIDHRTAAGRLEWLSRRYGLAPGDRVVHKTPLIFDVAVWEILGPLSAGATILLADPESESDVDHLGELLSGQRTVFAHFVPSMLDAYLQLAARRDYPALRWVQTSGEAVPARLLERFADHFTAEFHNMYGQTETSEVAAWEGGVHSGHGAVPIGRQIGIYRLFVLDEALGVVPVGVPGELCVAGLGGLARGYHRRPGLTAERFVPNPYPVAPGERLYRTGDLATVDEDGVITYRGRLDGQTKIRGCRVETDEVEAVLARTGADCVVVARPDESGQNELVAYVVGTGTSVPELAAHAERQLPRYMLPAVYITLDALPLGPSGKLDRRRLPAPTAADRAARVVDDVPQSPLETRLHELWRDVLGLDRIGRTDNFFAVGGNSLKSLQVLNRVNAAFNIRFSVGDFFRGPTIQQMAATVERLVVDMIADLSEGEADRLLVELKGVQLP